MSVPLPTGFDPTRTMEYLANLPEEEQSRLLQSAMGKVGEYQEQAQQSRTREGLIQRFKQARARFVRPGGAFAEQLQVGQITPDGVQELVVGTTHRGRYLCGWVAIDDAFFGIASSSLLLEDVTGQLVEIGAYGLVDPDLPPFERQHALASRFPKGQAIVVFEPYFKVRQDMSEGIRVEQPKEMIPWRDEPKDLDTWKKLGNDYFSGINTVNEGRGALACYERAIQMVKEDVGKVAVLLNNIATCRFKMGDYKAAVQLAGVAVHLDPAYVKGWFRLASALVEDSDTNQNEGKRRVVADRVIAHAHSAVPSLSAKDRRLLESTLKKVGSAATPDESPSLQSYVEWCMELDSPGVLLLTKDSQDDTKDTDGWRKAGSEYFTKGDFCAAEECYRKGMAAYASCCRDVALVLNNIAAVHLMLHGETSAVPGISVGGVDVPSAKSDLQIPNTEAALLNCTIAGIIDPLNHKAWARRARCLQKLGLTKETCITDLNAIRGSVVSRSFSSAESRERVQEFKSSMSTEVERRSKQPSESKTAHKVSDVPTEVQREQRDALQPDNIVSSILREESKIKGSPLSSMSGEEKESIDEYIARMEAFENMMRFGFTMAKSKSKRQQKDMPREMTMFVKYPPPQIHTEFPKLRGWPDGIDPTFAQKVLHRAYLDASANPWIMAASMRDSMFYQNMQPADLIKRWHGTEAMKILEAKGDKLRYGDIIDGRGEGAIPAYDARIRSNFANNPNRSEVYFFGTTHVAIGFNDFSSLLAAKIQDNPSTGTGPLRFVGFEMSEFAVAKCKVIARMLGSPDVSISSVMEVWLSSTWSATTLTDFRKCLCAVLKSLQRRKENNKVIAYLKHWSATETITASKARSEFFLNLERYNEKSLIAASCFRREIDRLDLVQYMLTGEIQAFGNVLSLLEKEQGGSVYAGAGTTESGKPGAKKNGRKKKNAKKSTVSPLVGSVTMWNVPAGAPPLEEDIAFNTVDFKSLVEDYAERQTKQKHSVDRLSVADLFIIHVMTNLRRLRDLMLANKLIIEVTYGVVKALRGAAANDPENQEQLARIAMLRPYTISWSNVLDYFLPEDFHDLARRCSMYGDCVHYGYSMNWPTQVYGASILDYDPENCKELINRTLDTALGFLSSSGSTMDVFKMMGLDKLLLLPIREHPLNSTGYVLAQVYKQHWVDNFMKTGELTTTAARRLGTSCMPSNRGLQKGEMDLGIPSPLYRTSLTIYMSWCYDPELRLQGANNPLELGAATDKDMMIEYMKHLSVEERQAFWKDVGIAPNK
ncbi:hypothetical protein PF005_g24736 [Phytophthora fragariae]|uniref:Uncharacterized protein n=1 Tax=Phytophthora fragariae TaxID=53985 RepID=A0A6A3W5L5_9STRA|nr:hypothetical protein PF003_g29109 [Phytophthora fragariae]KAE8924250.1 hypothetical protein PF009_g25514 [Phytophthora fragariae]KAE8978348.1 hypothetical protein PF011_g23280 [Phytophthora fragariae]KAE9077382.1 hypothetical protein PF007_g24263 [Phytophthora fragariae]KAE9082150.1 hypothetical protein PF010_g21703 [Phytophthora fragariae]